MNLYHVLKNISKRVALDYAHPVGEIFCTTSSTFDPNSTWGGVWTKLTDKFLVGAGSTYALGATGGEATHTLTTAEMPSHAHSVNAYASSSGGGGGGYMSWYSAAGGAQYVAGNSGGGNAHNNLPPYQAVYMWQRTS